MAKPLSSNALIEAHGRAGWTIVVMLFLSLGLFLTGIFRPFTSVTKLWLFEDQVSVYQGLVILFKAGEIFLFLILFVFTVVFPFVKITAMLVLWLRPRLDHDQARALFHFVANLGKWSMLDVFVVAILVLTVKSSSVASIEVADGLLFFFASVLLTQFASLWTGKLVSRLSK